MFDENNYDPRSHEKWWWDKSQNDVEKLKNELDMLQRKAVWEFDRARGWIWTFISAIYGVVCPRFLMGTLHIDIGWIVPIMFFTSLVFAVILGFIFKSEIHWPARIMIVPPLFMVTAFAPI